MTTAIQQSPAPGLAKPPIPKDSRARHLRRHGERVRRRIAGYSRFVSTMKFLLPTLAAALIALIAAWPHLQTQDNRFRVGFSALKAREATDPAMINARYIGTDENNLPFSVTADIARNLVENAEAIELEMPKADITLEDGSWLVLTAESGVYTRAKRHLDLAGAVNLFHDSGYEISTEKAHIDLAQGTANSAQPVRGHGPFGDLRAQGFSLDQKGKVIHFTGKAKLVLYPGLTRLEP